MKLELFFSPKYDAEQKVEICQFSFIVRGSWLRIQPNGKDLKGRESASELTQD